MNLNELINLLKNQFYEINGKKVELQIETYKNFLQEKNKIQNLTRLDKDDEIYEKYFYESIINFKNELFNKKNIKVLDIGSGSGIPGIVLKILFPEIDLYIVESNKKKVLFLNELIKKLNLKKTYIFNERCEYFIKSKRDFFDLITCRAVAELRILLELSFPGLKKLGKCFFLKSTNYLQEIENSKLICEKLNISSLPTIDKIEYNKKLFISLTYIKQSQTDTIYPRSWKEILNNDKN
ncbi:MAG: 16S rRNA (guanine(527)-N(7))-methyltransferase RsmG [Malacoplasma sp.]|nr:16S rRNA (guanine(527)-N(7))-methyltransferase RsmG [Malacoplasma sp.]